MTESYDEQSLDQRRQHIRALFDQLMSSLVEYERASREATRNQIANQITPRIVGHQLREQDRREGIQHELHEYMLRDENRHHELADNVQQLWNEVQAIKRLLERIATHVGMNEQEASA